MKPIILYVALLFFLITNSANSQCLVNSNFATFCGTQYRACPTFDSPCLDNWARSHGSPQIFVAGSPPKNLSYNYAYMWVANGANMVGEGIFASYTFLANHSYKITVTAQAAGSAGSFLVYATTGLTEGAYSCGDLVPVPSSQQLIMQNSPVQDQTWQTFTINFVPTANYTQLWIYPSTPSTTQYNFYASYVDACTDCLGTIIYNNGIVPSGNSKSGDIYAGSSAGTGGSGTVTVSPTASTSLQAVNVVRFKSEFHATVSTGTFSAKIIPCSDLLTPRSKHNNQQEVFSYKHDMRANKNIINKIPGINIDSLSWLAQINELPIQEENNISVFPNPSNGTIKIIGTHGNLKNAEIIVVDQAGRQMYHLSNKTENNILVLKLNLLNDGVYFIKINVQDKEVIKKIIISR